ncbi:MAG: hypothetical protein ACKVQU_22640 [Burkholderiales bacterium]
MGDGSFPQALPHGELREILPSMYLVTGAMKLARPPLSMSRNMTVVREPAGLVLVNSVRLSEQGLKQLDALGKVTDVIRLAGFHGRDDGFYKDRYGAKVWAVKGQRYTTGFATDSKKEYFTYDVQMDGDTKLPIAGARLYVVDSIPSEALLLLERANGVVIAGDCLQNWGTTDAYFNWPAKLMMRMMGFIKPHNIGPGWVKMAKPSANALRGILDLPFEDVLPSHGTPVLGGAKVAYQSAIDRAAGQAR